MSPPGPPQALGAVIRRQREINKLSMRQFATMAGISNPYLSQIERGLREPSRRVVDAIARSLERPVDDLYEEAGIPTHDESNHDGSARDALHDDPQLTIRQRRALIDIYDSFLVVNSRSPATRRKQGPGERHP